MKSEHTPGPFPDGPWEWRDMIGDPGSILYDRTGCVVMFDRRNEIPQQTRRLIAAAPSLVEALRNISNCVGPFDLDPLQHAKNCMTAMVLEALGAIEKATGEDMAEAMEKWGKDKTERKPITMDYERLARDIREWMARVCPAASPSEVDSLVEVATGDWRDGRSESV